ncbi:N-formylglutamate amidohydrolase [Caenimonas sedimenti]|uniref:N-formylglutamate amidohydrolase n=1 Tax=Caenimonas sedimenti TaxID=2596921 RepID=UPI0021044BD5|nr:N-formylglutamate amidohydrolase [Caenimonas sedimenti]
MPPYILQLPAAGVAPVPLVCDSPHSGTRYPADFGHAIDLAALRRSEDTHVDTLWSALPRAGAALLCATFPRSYIDCNRDEADIDLSMLQGEWQRPARPSQRGLALGNGLVWRRTPEHLEIYRRRLGAAEVEGRIDRYWRPYREALVRQLSLCEEAHGAWWHLNLHSMPSNAYERLGLGTARPLADVVLGDRHGSTCSPGFLHEVRSAFEAQGLTVAVNDPYEGAELVRVSGDPARHRHSLQVEINRALYMDEGTREPGPGFAALATAIGGVVARLAAYVTREGNALRDRQRATAAGS